MMAPWNPATFAEWMRDPRWRSVTNVYAWKDADVVQHLSKDAMERSHHLHCGLLKMPDPTTAYDPRTLGTLARLPNELLDSILGLLDLHTLDQFGETCPFAHHLSMYQSKRRQLQNVAPMICPLLKHTGLDYLFPLTTLSRELRHQFCRSCGQRGTLLCMTTCERICENCNEQNQAYWCLHLAEAKTAFAVELSDIEALPILVANQSIWKGTGEQVAFPASAFIAVKTILPVAVKKHGSFDAMVAAAERISPDRFPHATILEISKAQLFRYMRQATLGALNGDPSQVPTRPMNLPFTDRAGTLSALFPSVPEGWNAPVPVYRCCGCWIICHAPFDMSSEQYDLMGIDPADRVDDTLRKLRGRMFIVRTIGELRQHIANECLGARLLMFRLFLAKTDYR